MHHQVIVKSSRFLPPQRWQLGYWHSSQVCVGSPAPGSALHLKDYSHAEGLMHHEMHQP